MVLPLRPTVKLMVDQLAPSAMTTKSPVLGAAGRLIVNVPPEVSASICSFVVAVYVVVTRT